MIVPMFDAKTIQVKKPVRAKQDDEKMSYKDAPCVAHLFTDTLKPFDHLLQLSRVKNPE